jgi:hypothetical protein
MSTWDAVITSAPINRTAASVAAKPRTPQSEGVMGRAELIELYERLARKHRLLKAVLRVDTKAKHKNLVYRAAKGRSTSRGKANGRAVAEYVRLGHEMQRMVRTIHELKCKERGREPTTGNGWIAA